MLAKSSLQPSSIPTYRRAWRLFYQFLNAIFHSVGKAFPIAPHTLALFIAYMYDKKYAPSTVSSYVSALGYSHKFLGHLKPNLVPRVCRLTALGERGETLAHAGHVSPRIWEMTINFFKRRVG